MILSKRERYIVIGVVSVIVLFALDRMVYTPLDAAIKQTQADIKKATVKQIEDQGLLKNDRLNRIRWKDMEAKGLTADAAQVEGQVLKSLDDWAKEARLNLTSLKPEPERNEKDKQFKRISFRATGVGNADAIARFVWRIQSASTPLKITEFSLSARKDGVDDLNLQVGISTLLLAEQDKPAAPKAEVVTTPKEGKI